MSDHFEYRDEDHSYWLNGVRLLSATQMLKLAGIVNYGPKVLTQYMERGKRVHFACQLLVEGTLDWASVYEGDVGYVKAYEKYLVEHKPKIIRMEKPMYHPTLLYGVTPDHEEIDAVNDLKTGSMKPWTALQTMLQAMAIDPVGFQKIKRRGIELRADQTYRIETYSDPQDYQRCLSVIDIAKWSVENCGTRITGERQEKDEEGQEAA